MAALPNPNTLNVFAYYDPGQNAMIDILSNDNTHPRIIEDYVINPTDWQARNRGVDHGNGFGPPNGVDTAEGVLSFNTRKLVCFVCGQRGAACNGQVCIDIAKDQFQDVTDFKLQIREARWGYGVFAQGNIPRGTLIGEYLGHLMPLDISSPVDNRFTYTFDGRTDCNAQQYGNITRYINHNCRCNTDPITVMYGKRAVTAFKTNRAIAAGEEITIDYGTEYFNNALPCQCDAFGYPHTSETYRRHVHADGSVSPRGFGTYGCFRGQRGWGQSKQALFGSIEKARIQGTVSANSRVRKAESGSRKREKAAASKPRQRRLSWGSRDYKGREPDDNPLRRSGRISSVKVRA